MSNLSSRNALWIAVTLLAATALAGHLARTVGIRTADTGDVLMRLPDTVGDWIAEDVSYCQSDQCGRSFSPSQLAGVTKCPVCGSELGTMSVAERTMLPKDTGLSRKAYLRGSHRLLVTVVLTGAEQRSIHRPQQCFPAQGFAIEESRIVSVELSDRRDLGTVFLRAARSDEQGGGRIITAYWFVGGGREATGHFERLGWMAWDTMVRGTRTRWAYITVQSAADDAFPVVEQRITAFIGSFYPLIHKPAQ